MTETVFPSALHCLRRERKLALSELALLAGVPARRLAEHEYLGHRLRDSERLQLAVALGVTSLDDIATPAIHPRRSIGQRKRYTAGAVAAVAASIASLMLLPYAHARSAPPASRPPVQPARGVGPGAAALRQAANAPRRAETTALPRPLIIPTIVFATPPGAPPSQPAPSPSALPEATALPTPTPVPAELPDRCPLLPQQGRVEISQGYGVGTHAPAAVWGAVDLVVKDGPTYGMPVVATHDGEVFVALGTWPGGNYVAVTGAAGVRTAYAHLAEVRVSAGQRVVAGTVIGTVGSTGNATGPHLHYELWRDDINQDPTPHLFCQ